MSDSLLQTFLHYGTNAQRLAFTPIPPPSPEQVLYLWRETDTGNAYLYDTAWHLLTGGGGGGGGSSTGVPGADGDDGQDGYGIPGATGATGPAGSISTGQKSRIVGITIDGSGTAITTGTKGFYYCPYAGTITASTLLSTDAAVTSGSIVIDVWKVAFASYPPTVANTITASALPTLSSATNAQDTTLTGWTTSVSAGDVFGFHVNSATTVTRVTLELTVVAS